MKSKGYLYINPTVRIPLSELRFRFSRASGPGGQHVNRRETRVELLFDVASSCLLTAAQRQKLKDNLGGSLDADGVLRIVVDTHRSQLRNRREATDRFAEAIRQGLRSPNTRQPTKPSRASYDRRLALKRRHSLRKQMRRARPEE